jgi:hypothetical protein
MLLNLNKEVAYKVLFKGRDPCYFKYNKANFKRF